MDVVAPLRSRLALPEHASRVAAALVEGWDGQVPVVDTAAYGPLGEAAYVYRQRRDGSDHVGLVVEVRRDAVAIGRLRGHEAVFPDRVESLAAYLEAGHPQTSLISAVHRAGPRFREILAVTTAERPTLEVTTADGGEHTLWLVDSAHFAEVTAELADAVLYIADGHHRVAATQLYWDGEAGRGSAGLPVVVCPLDGLRLEPFHRVVPGPVSREQSTLLQDRLYASYDVSEVAAASTLQVGQVAMYAEGCWRLATSREQPEDHVDGLDAVLLERRVLTPAGAPTALPVRAPLDELVLRCDADGSVLFALAPPPLSTMLHIADRGEVMPAKTTSFQPKPVSGLLLSQCG